MKRLPGRYIGPCVINPYAEDYSSRRRHVAISPVPRKKSWYRRIVDEGGVEAFLIKGGTNQRNMSNPDGNPRSWWFRVALFTWRPNGWEVATQYQLEAETHAQFHTMTDWVPFVVSERKAAWLLDRIINSADLPGP